MKEKEDKALVEAFVGSPWEAELVKGLLASNDIQVVLRDGILGTLAPYFSNGVTIMVTQDDYEAAMQIIRDREKEENE
ncbi:DUF2007 domain-containing protein [Bacteroides sp. 214]|uniref:DUF2007-related protein n=1 Tax=Bacteroides sp. 214 TaxID=2302935 RepID=UPI0013D770AC|nr:DUF2007-related protein [Bacteroides sp. 214]NDW12581.1 DUF2007 domain-containing protein [Bacteroides sp. 214]